MENTLIDYPDHEKGAYLAAIASIATADAHASPEELEHLAALSDAAELSEESKQMVLEAAEDTSASRLNEFVQTLQNSDLRFSLVTDLIAFAESDGHYTPEEKQGVEKIAAKLNINQEQFSLLNEFVHKSAEMPAEVHTPAEAQGFFNKTGLGDKMSNAGINMGGLTKGLLAIVGPMLLPKFLNRKSGSGGGGIGDLLGGSGGLGGLLGGSGSGGGLGDLLGGNKSGGGLGDLLGGSGGLGGLLGGSRSSGGGLGSLISSLSGGRGFSKSGGLLGKIFN